MRHFVIGRGREQGDPGRGQTFLHGGKQGLVGIYTQGSQAAIEFLTNSEHMAELRQALLSVSPDHKTVPPYFQALLTTAVENAVPGTTSIVAVRPLGR